MDREDLLRRAQDLVPVLRQRAGLTEELRHLPEETIHDLCAAGLLRASQPRRFGGSALTTTSC